MLFRTEALSHAQQDHTEGRVLERNPSILSGCSIVAIAATGATAMMLFAAHYTPRLRTDGHLLNDGNVQLLVPASALPYIGPGQRIALHYPALQDLELHPPAPKDPVLNDPAPSPQPGKADYGAVQSISRLPVADAGRPPRYQILIKPDPRATRPPLQEGMAAQATLALGDVRLIDWIIPDKR